MQPPPPSSSGQAEEAILAAAMALIIGGGVGLLTAFVLIKLGYGQHVAGMVSHATKAISKRLRRQKR